MILKACAVCGRPTPGTRCEWHQAIFDAERAPRRRSYHSAHWKAVRAARLQLAGGRCELEASPRCSGVASHVHLRPSFKGDHMRATIEDLGPCAPVVTA
jgi:hypothetical protein